MTRSRKGKWIRQDARINKWFAELDRNDISVLEFLIYAQNVARTLQDIQMHLPSEVVESPEYPVQLAARDDLEEDPIGEFIALVALCSYDHSTATFS